MFRVVLPVIDGAEVLDPANAEDGVLVGNSVSGA